MTCQQCESYLHYPDDPNRGGPRPDGFCSWRCARQNMREHDELECWAPSVTCTCPTCSVTRPHEAAYEKRVADADRRGRRTPRAGAPLRRSATKQDRRTR